MNQYERKMNEMQLEAEDLTSLAQESNGLRDQLFEAQEMRKTLQKDFDAALQKHNMQLNKEYQER